VPTNRSAPAGARYTLTGAVRSQAIATPAASGSSASTAAAARPAGRAARQATAAGQTVTAAEEPLWDGPEPVAGSHEHAAVISGLLAEAGFPEMTGIAVKSGWNTATLKTKITKAHAIKSIAQAVNLPGMAAPLIRTDMTLQDARVALFTAKAEQDGAIRTDTTPPSDRNASVASVAKKPLDPAAVYERLNAPRGEPRNASRALPAARLYSLTGAHQ
jgi:hypothetical protein